MKTKHLILVIVAAVVTLSFTFGSAFRPTKRQVSAEKSPAQISAPLGGFAMEDKL